MDEIIEAGSGSSLYGVSLVFLSFIMPAQFDMQNSIGWVYMENMCLGAQFGANCREKISPLGLCEKTYSLYPGITENSGYRE